MHGMLSVQNYVNVILLYNWAKKKRHSKIIKDDVRRLQADDNINLYQCKQLKTKDFAKGCGEFSFPYHFKYKLDVFLKDFLDFSHKLLGLMEEVLSEILQSVLKRKLGNTLDYYSGLFWPQNLPGIYLYIQD